MSGLIRRLKYQCQWPASYLKRPTDFDLKESVTSNLPLMIALLDNTPVFWTWLFFNKTLLINSKFVILLYHKIITFWFFKITFKSIKKSFLTHWPYKTKRWAGLGSWAEGGLRERREVATSWVHIWKGPLRILEMVGRKVPLRSGYQFPHSLSFFLQFPSWSQWALMEADAVQTWCDLHLPQYLLDGSYMLMWSQVCEKFQK